MEEYKIGLVGATGYVGVELLKLFDEMDNLEVSFVSSSGSVGKNLYEQINEFKRIPNLQLSSVEDIKEQDLDYVFFATQHNFSMDYVPFLLEKDIKIIDLSADFRISDASLWAEAYEDEHRAKNLLSSAVYGLPEKERNKIKEANLVAVPGCYPTASILGLLPIVDYIKASSNIILDVKSGISGAGRNKVESDLSDDIVDNFKAYSAQSHRHQFEIGHFFKKNYKLDNKIVFTPHLLPIFRGEYVTCYVETSNFEDSIQETYENFYKNEKFVRVLTKGTVPELKKVQNTNFCDISVFMKENILTIHIAIDNLMKGAASQAIQCFNLMSGANEYEGVTLKDD